MAVPYFLHSSRNRANWRRASAWSLWKLPGLIRTFSTTEATAMAVSEEKWMSATSGTLQPAARTRALISRTCGTSCRPGTVMRTSCAPAFASRSVCATVASTSYVWVLHIVWTTTGLFPPMRTSPTLTTRVSIVIVVSVPFPVPGIRAPAGGAPSGYGPGAWSAGNRRRASRRRPADRRSGSSTG